MAVAILDELRGLGVAKDVVVTTPDEIAAWGTLIGTVLEPADFVAVLVQQRGPRTRQAFCVRARFDVPSSCGASAIT